ncbi:hypothetical protein [Streptomyces cyaneochromogenes]|uniref:hypothetical protein n=1 Tax=Streptomyces cyaneochromogenes TaxID=2496836 RepID=UPI001E42C67A|nr:hypothetical protein [Streptomyces cyaneochromogenes]
MFIGTVLAPGLQRVLLTRCGTLGVLGLCFTTVGIKARNATCASIGAAMLALAMTQA